MWLSGVWIPYTGGILCLPKSMDLIIWKWILISVDGIPIRNDRNFVFADGFCRYTLQNCTGSKGILHTVHRCQFGRNPALWMKKTEINRIATIEFIFLILLRLSLCSGMTGSALSKVYPQYQNSRTDIIHPLRSWSGYRYMEWRQMHPPRVGRQ